MTEVFGYFHAHGALDLALLVLNGTLATMIGLILVLARSPDCGPLAWHARLARYVLVVVYATIALRVWGGWYWTPVEPTEVVANAVLLWLVMASRGDVSLFLAALRIARERSQTRRLGG
ncbi:phage holin family protein [Cupriavidus sp. D384]|uniref:phage holin family protein n=1 Tax=Cupriavidus sp. D384 TaxID=1538095 RepID=UPI000836CAED|nr:phage holin family protein [Cupriavidus sp. D384]